MNEAVMRTGAWLYDDSNNSDIIVEECIEINNLYKIALKYADSINCCCGKQMELVSINKENVKAEYECVDKAKIMTVHTKIVVQFDGP